MYFYSSSCPASQKIEPYIRTVREFWKDKIEWADYDFMDDKNLPIFESYGVANVPVAIVNCANKSFRIERGEIVDTLNQTITSCYSEIKPVPTINSWIISLVLLFGLVSLKDLKKR